MKKILLVLLSFLCGLTGGTRAAGLAEGFASPPDQTKPWCYWYWISDNLSKTGITKDLEAMARVGIGEALIANNRREIRDVVRENHKLLTNIGVVPEKVQSFVRDIEAAGYAAKVCGAGAVAGDAGGMVLVFADRQPNDLCKTYGFEALTIHGDPLGVRLV